MPIAIPVALTIGGGVIGLVVGSFLGNLVVRWPRGESVVRGRSRCDGCGRRLAIAELVPVLSHAVLRGRCRGCGSGIDPRHLFAELACALLGGLALATHPGPDGALGAVFGWLLLALAMLDVGHLWLPDALVLPLPAIGLAAGAAGMPPSVTDRLIGGLAGFLLLEAVRRSYRRVRGIDGMGRGDPKLFAAIGAWIGWRDLPIALFGAAAAGLLGVALLSAIGRRPSPETPLPFGALLALSGWSVWLLMPG